MPAPAPIYVEADGAMSRRECGPGGPLVAAWLVNCQPFATPNAQMQTNIGYGSMKEGSGFRGPHLLSIGSGTFAYPGRTESNNGKTAMVGATLEQLVAWYEQGCIDFRTRTNLPDIGWVGCEFENTRAVFDLIRQARRSGLISNPVDVYFNWEFALDVWGMGNQVVRDAIFRLLASDRFLERLPKNLSTWSQASLRSAVANLSDPNFDTVWRTVDYALRTTLNRTAHQWLRAAGHQGRYVLSNSAAPARPCVRFDGRVQPSSELQPGQVNHMGWYFKGPIDADARVRMAAWVAASRSCFDTDVYHHFELKAPAAGTLAGIQAVQAPCILWGDPADLANLPNIAAAVAAWS